MAEAALAAHRAGKVQVAILTVPAIIHFSH